MPSHCPHFQVHFHPRASEMFFFFPTILKSSFQGELPHWWSIQFYFLYFKPIPGQRQALRNKDPKLMPNLNKSRDLVPFTITHSPRQERKQAQLQTSILVASAGTLERSFLSHFQPNRKLRNMNRPFLEARWRSGQVPLSLQLLQF